MSIIVISFYHSGVTTDTGIDFSKILGGQTKILGQKVVKSDEWVFLNYCGHMPGLPPKVYAYDYRKISDRTMVGLECSYIHNCFFSGSTSHTFSSQTLFISVFYMNFTWYMQHECDNAFPDIKCVPEPFSQEKSTVHNWFDSAMNLKFNQKLI